MSEKLKKQALPVTGEGYHTGSTSRFVRKKENNSPDRKSVFDKGVRTINLNLMDSKLRQKNPMITREQFKPV